MLAASNDREVSWARRGSDSCEASLTSVLQPASKESIKLQRQKLRRWGKEECHASLWKL